MSKQSNETDHDRLVVLETEVEILKRIVFGAVGVILLAVFGAVTALVVK